MSHHDRRNDMIQARARYHQLAEKGTPTEIRAAADAAKAAGLAFTAAITEGAKPCPFCAKHPHGIEQPRSGGDGYEYEIGCLTCPPFKYADGTMRQVRVRGGLLPRHAVDAWNEGPDNWIKEQDANAPVRRRKPGR